MADNTEELRDIFRDVADEDTVTASQEASRGTLTGDRPTRDRLREVIEAMRAEQGFDTDLDDDALATVVEGFYDGDSDTAIAEALDVSRSTVGRARMDLHLFRDRDTDAPFDLETLRDRMNAGLSTADIAADLDVSPSTVRRYRRVVDARKAARRVSHRFRSAFEDVLRQVDVAERLTEDGLEDGLEDATEGTETNVSF